MRKINLSNNYEKLKEKIKQSENNDETFRLNVLKINYEIILEEYKAAQNTLEELMRFSEVKLQGSSELIPYIIRAAFILGRVDNISEKLLQWGVNLKDLPLDNEYNFLFMNYLCVTKAEVSLNKINKLIQKSPKKEINAIAYYLKAIASENNEDKRSYLKKAYHESKYNYSILKYAFENKINIEDEPIINCSRMAETQKNSTYDKKGSEELGVEFSVLGGGNSIGGSCYLLKFKGFNILIDAGVSFGKKEELIYPDFDKLKDFGIENFSEIDAFLLTHAHLDHSGAVSELYKRSGNLTMYATEETCELSSTLLGNCIKRESNYASKKFELDTCLSAVRKIKFREPVHINKKNKKLKIEYFRAGHILGAAAVYLEVDGHGIFFTGDYCLEDQKTVEGLDIPRDYPVELLITEATYGNSKGLSRIPRRIQEKKLAECIYQKIKENKRVLVPAFALGRSQEIVSILLDYMKKEQVKPFRIYLDGLVTDVSKKYSEYTEFSNKSKNLFVVNHSDIYEDKYEFIDNEVMTHNCCVIASSGMLKNESASSYYAEKFIEDSSCVCIITGYQDEEAPGYRLKQLVNCSDGEKYIEINSKMLKVKCEVEEYYLSAHCDIGDIFKVASTLKPNNICLVHGVVKKNERSNLFDILSEIEGVHICQSYDGETYRF